jgi:DNA modification methylase
MTAGRTVIGLSRDWGTPVPRDSLLSYHVSHPARFPAELPRFFMRFLTTERDLVLDPFAGSNTTGAVAESLNRRWIGIEKDRQYAEDSQLRFLEPSEDETTTGAPAQVRLFAK